MGATPKDASDDAAAIDSVGANVGVVYIPKGWYTTTGVVVRNTYRNVRIVGAGRASHLELTASDPLIRFVANDGGVEHETLDCHGVADAVGLRVAAEIATASGGTTQFSSFHDSVVRSCTVAGIVLRWGDCYYNPLHTIHVIDSALGIRAMPGTARAPGANRNDFFSVWEAGRPAGSLASVKVAASGSTPGIPTTSTLSAWRAREDRNPDRGQEAGQRADRRQSLPRPDLRGRGGRRHRAARHSGDRQPQRGGRVPR